MDAQHVTSLIQAGMPEAEVKVEDIRGDGMSFSAQVISPKFEGLSLIEQHRMVYHTIDRHIGSDIHALRLKTQAR